MTDAGGGRGRGGGRGYKRKGGGRGGGRADQPTADPSAKKKRYMHATASAPGDSGFRVGARGFLISCVTGKEAVAGREAVSLVESAWEELVPQDGGGGGGPAGAGPPPPPPPDLGGALEAELADLRAEEAAKKQAASGAKPPPDAPYAPAFRWHALGIGCLVFISMAKPPRAAAPADGEGGEDGGGGGGGEGAPSTSPPTSAPSVPYPGPVDLALHLARGIAASGQARARFVHRLLPVEAVVPATLPSLTSAVSGLAKKHLPGRGGASEQDGKAAGPPPASYAVAYEHRSSGALDRMAVINALVAGVPAGHPVSLDAPDVTIFASAVRALAAIAVIPGYARLARLNLRELACPSVGKQQEEGKKGGEAEAAAAGGGEKAVEAAGG